MQRYLLATCLCLLLFLPGACRSGDVEINVMYDQIAGLLVDDPLILQGGQVGTVTAIHYTRDGRYGVLLQAPKEFTNALTEHAQFFIVGDPRRPGRKAVEIRHARPGGNLLASGATVEGAHEIRDVGRRLHSEIETGLRMFKQHLDQFGREIQEFGESKAYRDLKQTMKDLAEELSRKERAARDKLKREWLPRIQRELDDLREKLRELGREKEMAPLDVQFEQLRRI